MEDEALYEGDFLFTKNVGDVKVKMDRKEYENLRRIDTPGQFKDFQNLSIRLKFRHCDYRVQANVMFKNFAPHGPFTVRIPPG